MSGAAQSLEDRELTPRQAGELVTGEARGEVVADAIARVADGRVAVRRNALLVLSLVDPPVEAVLATADIARKDEDALVRRHAVSIFGHEAVPVARAMKTLLRALNDDDEGVAMLAADGIERALRRSGPQPYLQLIDGLADGSFVMLIRATEIFRRLGDNAIVTLTVAIAHPNGFIRKWARDTLGHFGGAAIPVLLDALRKPALREAAVRTLEGMSAFEESHMEAVAVLSGGADVAIQAAAFRVLMAMQKVFERRQQRPATVSHPEFYARSLEATQLATATEGIRAADLLWNLRDGRSFVRANSVVLMGLVAGPGDPRDLIATALRPLLRDPDARVRAAVIAWAIPLVGPLAVPLLLAAAAQRGKKLAARALAALEKAAGELVPEIFDALDHARDVETVERGVAVLVKGGGKEAHDMALRHVAAGRTATGRAASIGVLVGLGGKAPADRAALVSALEDDDAGVRRTAARGLAQIVRDDAAVIAALKALAGRESDLETRRAAALAADVVAGRPPRPKVLPPTALPMATFSERALSRAEIDKAKAKLPLEAVKPLLTDGRPEVRANAAAALALHDVAGDEDVVRWLMLSLRDDDGRVRAAAAHTLGVLRPAPTSVIPRLAEALQHADSALEVTVMAALAAYGRGAVGPALEALADRAHLLDATAARLAAVIPDELVGAVASYLHRPARPTTRGVAADLLAAMGPRAAGAWKDLAEAAEDPLGRLRVRVVRAIGRCAEPGVTPYETLLVLGHHDARASVRGAVEEAITTLVARLDPAVAATPGGVEEQIQAWLATIPPKGKARTKASA